MKVSDLIYCYHIFNTIRIFQNIGVFFKKNKATFLYIVGDNNFYCKIFQDIHLSKEFHNVNNWYSHIEHDFHQNFFHYSKNWLKNKYYAILIWQRFFC